MSCASDCRTTKRDTITCGETPEEEVPPVITPPGGLIPCTVITDVSGNFLTDVNGAYVCAGSN